MATRKLSDILKEEEERGRQASEQTRIEANQQFNDIVDKKGAYDTSKHYTTIGKLKEAYKGTSNYDTIKNSINNYYKENNRSISLWDKVKFIAKRFGNEALGGVTSIGEAETQTIANNLQKGRNQSISKNIQNNIGNLINIANPMATMNKVVQNATIDTLNNLTSKDRSVKEKIVMQGLNAVSNAQNILPVKNMLDESTQLLGKVLPEQASDKVLKLGEKISKPYYRNNEELNKESENFGNGTNLAGNVFGAVGRMVPSIVGTVTTKNPSVGLAIMGTGAKGSATKEALDKGASLDEAVKIGDTQRAIEIGTEMISGGVNIFGKGALDEIVEKGISSKVKSNVGKFLAKQGYNLGGEVLEETVSDVLDTFIKQGTTDKNASYSLKDFGDTAITTMLSTLVLNTLTGGLTGDIKTLRNENRANQNAQEWINKAQNIINNVNNPNLQQNATQNQNNINVQQITQQENQMVQNELSEQTSDIANNQETLYNSFKESESGNNGEIQREGMAGISGQFDTRVQQNSQQQQNKKYTRQEYEKFEQSIKPIEQSKLTIEQKSSINNYKRQYNKDIVFFDGKNNQEYLGGASLTDKNKIYINTNSVENFGENKIINHEIMESDIRHNRDISNDIIKPAIQKIIDDPNFEKQKNSFWKNQEGEMPSDYLIAKDILCDRFSEIKTGEKLDYDNLLSQETNMTMDYSLENFYRELYGKKVTENSNIQPIGEKVKANNTFEISSNMPLGENTKIRKHYKSIMQSQYTSDEAKSISKQLMGIDTYVPDSNTKQLERANQRIEISGPDSELKSLMARASTGGNIKADDIAVGERLIQYYSKIGDKEKLQDAIQATAMAGTTAGQTVQAMSLLNHQTPEGQAVWIQRSVEKMNRDLVAKRGKKAEQFNLTPEMKEKIVNSKNSEELANNLNEVYKELGQQVTKTMAQKIDSWRYFAMLANPRTHIRNIVGNTAMSKTQGIKNKVAGVIEGVVSRVNPKIERNHTIVPSSKEVKEFAKKDIKNVVDRLGLNENKYNPKTRLESSMRTFKSNTMEKTVGKLFDINDKTLEAEDGLGLKAGYRKALSEYMTANKLTPGNITDAQLARARNYAVEQAKEATFHQVSSIATLLNQFSNKNKFTKFIMDSTLPFKKTPINVAKSGLEYSPVGLVKNMIYDTAQLRKGNITVNKYIDNMSKGLTGTGIALVGYALADMGILKASGGDGDDKEKYEEGRGKQTYAITIGDNTYSLDWLAPTGIPLFVGAECYAIGKTEKETKSSSSDEDSKYNQIVKSATNILDSFTNVMNPMTEMSMLSGLTSALKSYDQGSNQMIANMGTNAVKSYVNQFVPTALGQVAKTIDEYDRNTISTKTGILPRAIDTTKNQIMNKTPGLRQQLPIKTDIWGEKIKQPDNIVQRALENAVFPWTRRKIESVEVDKALTDLYNKTGESSILPSTLDKKITINETDYRLTNEEYSKYKEQYGKTSYNLIEKLVSSNVYKNMTNEQKQKSIESVYSYAKEKNKVDYAIKNNEKIKTSTLYNTLEMLKREGGIQSEYLSYVGKTLGVEKEKEKNQILLDSNYTAKTKSIIYKNTTGKDDELYNNILEKTDINIDSYLDYKLQKFESDKKDDGTLKGKSIANSKKKKVYEYIKNMKNVTYEQKLILMGTQYKLNTDERKKLAYYIKSLPGSVDEKTDMFSKFDKNFKVYKNGNINW